MKWTIFAIMFLIGLLGCWMLVLSAQAEIDGVVIIENRPLSTATRVVNVLIPASVSGGRVVQEMCVSVGTECNSWQNYNKAATVYLNGEVGSWHSICAKVRDNVGIESAQSCTQIQLVSE